MQKNRAESITVKIVLTFATFPLDQRYYPASLHAVLNAQHKKRMRTVILEIPNHRYVEKMKKSKLNQSYTATINRGVEALRTGKIPK